MSRLMEIADEANELATPDKLWLIERLARSVRQESEPITSGQFADLQTMSQDPQVRLVIEEIEEEFAVTEFDGLKSGNAT